MKLKGVILILSCDKYINTRVKENFFDRNVNDWYNDWKFITLKGNLNIENDYEYDKESYILTVKSEDSYLHLIKKRILGIKYVKTLFDLEEGILCCGDDVMFNKNPLTEYLNSNNKNHYEGKNQSKPWNYDAVDRNLLKITVNDLWMYNYYKLHPEQMIDFTLEYLKSICKRPSVWGAAGPCFYLSNKSCCILVKHMENINYNIFHKDEFTQSYPYCIEDSGISFILYYYNIAFINNNNFYTHNKCLTNCLSWCSQDTWHTNVPNLKWRL